MALKKRQKYPPPRVIAVDVDGTLLVRGEINTKLAAWCREKKNAGFYMILWSSRGRKHASNVAESAGITDVFDTIISKPGYVVDDKGWGWIKHTRVFTNLEE